MRLCALDGLENNNIKTCRIEIGAAGVDQRLSGGWHLCVLPAFHGNQQRASNSVLNGAQGSNETEYLIRNTRKLVCCKSYHGIESLPGSNPRPDHPDSIYYRHVVCKVHFCRLSLMFRTFAFYPKGQARHSALPPSSGLNLPISG